MEYSVNIALSPRLSFNAQFRIERQSAAIARPVNDDRMKKTNACAAPCELEKYIARMRASE
jgi:hypothetical protein